MPTPPFRILSKEPLTPVTHRFVVEAPFVARAARPGQFVIVRVHEHGERIPVTIADFDAGAGTVTVVVQAVGRTSTLFNHLSVGEAVLDLVGPLGEPFQARPKAWMLGVGGGFGAAALYPLARALHQDGVATEAILGARSREFLILEPELTKVCRQVMTCTDDGSYGFKGFVTDRLKSRLEELKPLNGVEVVAIGPHHRHRADGDDAGRGGPHGPVPGAYPCLAGPDHGGRHRHVRRLPRDGRRAGQICLRGRPALRRAPGGF